MQTFSIPLLFLPVLLAPTIALAQVAPAPAPASAAAPTPPPTLPTPTPTLSAISIYQAAVANNLVYISPPAGAAIINNTAVLNWKNILLGGANDTALGTAMLGLTHTISMSGRIELSLVLAHAAGDYLLSKLSQTAPTGTAALSPILYLSPGSAIPLNSEWTIFVSQFDTVSGATLPKRLKLSKGVLPPALTLTTSIPGSDQRGHPVTFVAQSIQTVILASGSKIKGLIAVDVLVGE